MNRLAEAILKVGRSAEAFWRATLDLAGLLYDTLGAAARPGRGLNRTLLRQSIGQILFTGVEALWLVTVIALVTGATVVLQAQANMPRFGVSQYFGDLLIVVAVKELGPFFTALVVIGRSGAALAAYIGNMRVTREIDALEVMGIDPVRFVVLPAFWGMVVAVTCLNLYFAGIAIVGGLAVAGATVNLPFAATLGKVMEALTLAHVLTSFFKGVLFGLAIGIASSYHGLRVQSIRGVPQAAIKAVVLSMALVLVLNLVITMAANALGEVFANA